VTLTNVIPRFKRWAGLYRSADVGALFRRRDVLGLQMTSVELHYQRMQQMWSSAEL